MDAGELLADQVGYYRRRASEYDRDMWQRHSSDAALAVLFDAADRWFASLPVRGRVLELGCGTGAWTVPLASRAESVVAVDAAPEMLQVAADRISAHGNVELIEADLFDWTPPGRFEVVFASFVYSHVPRQHEPVFWDLIATALTPGGLVAIIDAAPQRASEEEPDPDDPDVVRRRLRDGSTHRIVKVFRESEDVAASMRRRGWHARAHIINQRLLVAHASSPGPANKSKTRPR